MTDHGRVSLHTLPDGRVLEYWDGGDPDGRPLILHDGTPATYALAPPIHGAAVEHGVRLVSVHRPGYGRSTPTTASLSTVGHDTTDLARSLGFAGYAVVGISGGGPFAAAVAVLDAEHVRALGIVDAVGPWPEIDPQEEHPDERALLARLGTDPVEEVRADWVAAAESELGGLRTLDDDARLATFLASFEQTLASDPAVRDAWAASLRLLLDGPHGFEGYVFDNLAWGGPWDIDASAVTVPTAMWFGEGEAGRPSAHGQWYADRIPRAQLTVLPGLDHVQICMGSWPLIFPALLDF